MRLRGGLAFEIGIIGRQVRGRLGRELVAHAVAQRRVERTGHLRRDVGLHLEDVRERRVERLLPLGGRRGPGLDPDELGTDPHPARPAGRLLPLHRGGEQVIGPELAGDLLRRLGRLAVFVRAGPRDDGEPRDLRELAAHLVRDPIGEVGSRPSRPGSRTGARRAAWGLGCRPPRDARVARRRARRARREGRAPSRDRGKRHAPASRAGGRDVATRAGAVADTGAATRAREPSLDRLVAAARAERSREFRRRARTGRPPPAPARVITAASTCSGTLGRACRTRGTSPLNRLAMIACAVGPVKGGSPASISYSTAPSE